ncbi:MAG: hypothetical protein R3C44_17660 [Chloroflexota bacterium]
MVILNRVAVDDQQRAEVAQPEFILQKRPNVLHNQNDVISDRASVAACGFVRVLVQTTARTRGSAVAQAIRWLMTGSSASLS